MGGCVVIYGQEFPKYHLMSAGGIADRTIVLMLYIAVNIFFQSYWDRATTSLVFLYFVKPVYSRVCYRGSNFCY